MDIPMRAVAAQLGVKPDTLRKWERRWGLPGPRRGAGGHRRYGWPDLALRREFVRKRRAGADGATAARLARLASRAGGREADRAREAARRAVRRLDEAGLERLYARVTAAEGLGPSWEKVWRPLLEDRSRKDHEVPQRTAEHGFLRNFLLRALGAPFPPPRAGRRRKTRLLLAMPEGDRDIWEARLFQARLAERGCSAVLVGEDLPEAALAAAVRRSGVRRVCLVLSAPHRRAALRAYVARLRRRLPRASLAIAGPGALTHAAVIPRWGADFVGVDFETAWERLGRS